MYGYTEDNSDFFQFGLNTNCKISSISYKTDNGKEFLEIIIKKGENSTNKRYYKITQAYLKSGGTTTDRNTKEFRSAEMNLGNAILHIFSTFIKVPILKNALKEEVSFQSFIEILINLLPDGYKDIPVDIFMEYQYTLKPGNERTYLQLPDKTYLGKFITKSIPNATWEEKKIDTTSDNAIALAYVTEIQDEDGNTILQHEFKRTKKYMDSNRAKLQKLDTSEDTPNELDGLDLL